MEPATLTCIAFYDKDTQTLPRFRLTYEDRVWEFHEYNRGAASQQARWTLDHLVFGSGDVKWYPGIGEKRIPYVWEE